MLTCGLMPGPTMKKILVFLLLVVAAGLCENHARDPVNDRQYHSIIPLGAERIDLKPSKRELFILATAESPAFEGWHSPMGAQYLLNPDGSRVDFYPGEIGFRLTATAMRPDMLLLDPYGTLTLPDGAINSYLLHLRFRMLIFHGLEITRVQPQAVRLIGMPSEVNYDERIYQMSFNLPRRVPITDRIVVEVLAPAGYRVCKFHLDLF
jgi:hypothetical protein